MEKGLIMVIDDEKQMRDLIRFFLEEEGYSVIEASDGAQALLLLKNMEPDLLLVDVMMPFVDGFSFAQEVKETSSIPLIFLSAKGESWDKVHGLKLGADDYIVKPFDPSELLARIESVLRRSNYREKTEDIIEIGPITINKDAQQVKLDGDLVNLTRKEFGLLYILAKHHNHVYSREKLLNLVWGSDHQSSERTVDTHIKTLRIKMKKHGSFIKTVWGIGYKLEVDV